MSDVIYPWAKVYVNGQDYGVHEVEIAAQAGNDLPGRLNLTSSITQRTGTIRWDAEASKNLLLSPAHRAGKEGFTLPGHGDRIQIRMGAQATDPKLTGYDAGELVFTGKVDYSETPHDGWPVTHIVDDIDRLNRIVRLPPMKHHMPPTAGTKIGWYLHTHLTPDAVLGFIGAQCGYHVTPPPSGTVYLSAPLQGTALVTQQGHGRLVNSAFVRGDDENLPEFVRTSKGLALAKGALDFDPAVGKAPERLVISTLVGAQHTGRVVIYARLRGHDTQLRVVIEKDRRVWAQVGQTLLGHVTPGPDRYVSVAFHPTGKTELAAGTQRVTVQHPAWETGSIEAISVDAYGGNAVAGINVCGHPAGSTHHPALSFEQTAFIDCGHPYPLHISRSVRDEKAISVIQEICEAICCISYLDGAGALRIRYARSAYGAPVAGTLTAKRDVTAFAVRDDSQLAAYRAVVKYKTVDAKFTNKSRGSYVTLWEAPSAQLEAGESAEYFISPGADEEFFEVDTTLTYANRDDEARENFNRGNGSFSGFTSGNGTSEWWSGGRVTFETITPWTFKLTLVPDNQANTRVPEVATVRAHCWGAGMPVIRGGAKALLVDADPVIATGGHADAADLIHEAGPWVTQTRAQDIAQHIMALAKQPLPVIRGLECFFDPTIQLGQRWVLDLEAVAGIKATCFILGIKHNPASDTTSLDVRLLADSTGWSWGALAQQYASFQAVQDDFSTFAALEKGPA